MAYTVVQRGTPVVTASAGTLSITLGGVTAGNRVILVAYSWDNPTDTRTVSGGGLTWTLHKANNASASGFTIAVWSATAGATGNLTVTFSTTVTPATASIGLEAYEISGLAAVTTTENGSAGSSGTNSGPNSGTYTTTAANEFSVGAVGGDSTIATETAGTGWANIQNFIAAGSGGGASEDQDSGAAGLGHAANFGNPITGDWSAVSVTFVNSGGAVVSMPPDQRRRRDPWHLARAWSSFR